MIEAAQVAEAVHDEPQELPIEIAALGLTGRLLHRDDNVAEHAQPERPARGRRRLALELREREHVGGAIDPAVVAVERVNLEIAREEQGELEIRARGV